MKHLILWLILLLPAFAFAVAVEDDGNAATRQGRFSMEQTPPDPIITKYLLFYWKADQTRSDAVRVEFPSPPQVGTSVYVEVIVDGFEQGATYNACGRSASATDESDDTATISFTMDRYPATAPKLPNVEIQVSANSQDWTSIAIIPLDEIHHFVRAAIENSKVKIQVSQDLQTWQTIAYIPLVGIQQFIKNRIEPPEP